jgi:hypothetical protein
MKKKREGGRGGCWLAGRLEEGITGVSFTGEFFAKFRPEKYDFHVYNGFIMEKMTQILQIFKNSFFK